MRTYTFAVLTEANAYLKVKEMLCAANLAWSSGFSGYNGTVALVIMEKSSI